MKADLHIHSDISDGPLAVRDIFIQAKRVNLGLISITDHDTVKSQFEHEKTAADTGIKYIKGIEMSAFDKEENVRVHILGYGYKNGGLLEDFCSSLNKSRKEAGIKMVERLIELGYPVSMEDMLQISKGGTIYKQHIMHALYLRGLAKSFFEPLYNQLFGKGGLAYFPFEYLDPCEAVKVIKQSGGLAVCAHPADYNNWKCISRLINAGLDGLEVYHPGHSDEDVKALLEIAKDNNLFITGGSDFHGMYAKNPVPVGFGAQEACETILNFI